MERNYGEQSYNPKRLNLMYMGEGPNKYWELIDGNIIRQNILWACYNDSLTEEEISLQIGVALPYIENDINLESVVAILTSFQHSLYVWYMDVTQDDGFYKDSDQ